METEHFEKIITVNDQSFETVRHCIDKLLFFMYKENPNNNVEYFRLRLKDSEKSPFAKDLLLEWVCPKQPERLSPEDDKVKWSSALDEYPYKPIICDSPILENK